MPYAMAVVVHSSVMREPIIVTGLVALARLEMGQLITIDTLERTNKVYGHFLAILCFLTQFIAEAWLITFTR